MIEDARTQYPAMKQKYEKRKAELKEAKYRKMLKKQQEKKDEEDRQSARKINAFMYLLIITLMHGFQVNKQLKSLNILLWRREQQQY